MFNTFIVHPLFNLLAGIYAVIPGHDFGVAIIIFTILVRLALWPILAKQLHSQRAMQKIAPDIAKVKLEAAGDKTKESQLLMELYKEKEINPFASLVPLFIQIPIFLALFAVLKDIIKTGEIARLAYEPIRGLGAIKDIIANGGAFKPTLFGIVNLAKPSLVIAALAGIGQYIQTKQLLPKKHSAGDPQAAAMAGMSIIFPFLTVFIGLSLASALSLYWVSASTVAIFQQWLLLRRDVSEMEDMTEGIIVEEPKAAIGAGKSSANARKRAKK